MMSGEIIPQLEYVTIKRSEYDELYETLYELREIIPLAVIKSVGEAFPRAIRKADATLAKARGEKEYGYLRAVVEGEWQPIETAPFDKPILISGWWKPTWTAPESRMVVWERDSRNPPDDFYCRDINGDATHWMPLPEPPRGDNG